MPLVGRLKDGGLSMNAIAGQLNASNMPTMRGGRCTAKAVSRVVTAGCSYISNLIWRTGRQETKNRHTGHANPLVQAAWFHPRSYPPLAHGSRVKPFLRQRRG